MQNIGVLYRKASEMHVKDPGATRPIGSSVQKQRNGKRFKRKYRFNDN